MKLKKFLFILVLAALFFISLLLITSSITNLFQFNSGEIISSKQLEKIKNSVSSERNKSAYLNLVSFQGNPNYVALTYKDTRYEGQENTFNVFYDVEKSKILNSINYNDTYINVLDAISINHIKDDIFIIIDSTGNIYNVDFSKKYIKLVGEIDISKKTHFKSIYSNSSLYVISRNYYSKFNEKLLNSNSVYKIDFTNKRHTVASIQHYDFGSSPVYSFVTNLKGDIGVVYSDFINVSNDEVKKVQLITDIDYLTSLPTENNNYKFIDSSSIKVKFLNSNSDYTIPSSFIKESFINIHHKLNESLNLNLSSPSNIPFVLDDTVSYYFDMKYEDKLYDLAIYPTHSVLINTNSNLESSSIVSRSELLMFNNSKYIGFLNTNDGLIGIDKQGNSKQLSESKMSYVYNNNILYFNNGAIYYK